MQQSKLDEFADEAADLAREALDVASLNKSRDLHDGNKPKVIEKFEGHLSELARKLDEVRK